MYVYMSVTVASNHGNIYTELLALLIGHCGVLHSKVNGTGKGVGMGKRTANRQDGADGKGQGRRERGRGHAREQAAGDGERAEKRPPLVGDVQEYMKFYKEGGGSKIRRNRVGAKGDVPD